jgi:hypothetical protein
MSSPSSTTLLSILGDCLQIVEAAFTSCSAFNIYNDSYSKASAINSFKASYSLLASPRLHYFAEHDIDGIIPELYQGLQYNTDLYNMVMDYLAGPMEARPPSDFFLDKYLFQYDQSCRSSLPTADTSSIINFRRPEQYQPITQINNIDERKWYSIHFDHSYLRDDLSQCSFRATHGNRWYFTREDTLLLDALMRDDVSLRALLHIDHVTIANGNIVITDEQRQLLVQYHPTLINQINSQINGISVVRITAVEYILMRSIPYHGHYGNDQLLPDAFYRLRSSFRAHYCFLRNRSFSNVCLLSLKPRGNLGQ